jgi:hypothetical protein
MNSQEESMEQLLRSSQRDWRPLQRAKRCSGERLAHVKRLGAPWCRIAHETSIPMTDVRCWAKPFLATSEDTA